MLLLVHIITALGFGDVQVHQEPRVCEEWSQDPVQGGEDERNRSGHPGEASQHFSFSFLDLWQTSSNIFPGVSIWVQCRPISPEILPSSGILKRHLVRLWIQGLSRLSHIQSVDASCSRLTICSGTWTIQKTFPDLLFINCQGQVKEPALGFVSSLTFVILLSLL